MFNEFTNNIKIIGKFKYRKGIESKLNKTDFNSKIKHSKESSYLHQYKKYFQKKLVIKYNVLPKEYTLIQIENFIRAKYCHSLAKFKEDLLYNYQQEFLKQYYKKKESMEKLPLFSEFYNTYLKFFCSPTLTELKLNELIEEVVERKAKCYYQKNYPNEKEEKKDSKIINTIFFTNKIRKDISRKNTLTDLSKTTIDFIPTTNKNSCNSNMSINLLVNEIGNEKKNINNNFSNNKITNITEENKSTNINNINKFNSNKIMNATENKNSNKNIKNNSIRKKLNNILKISIKEIYNYGGNKKNFITKKAILKNTPTANINPKEANSINHRTFLELKINQNNAKKNNFSNSKSKNKTINSKTDINNIRTREKNNFNSKPLYSKINIVNNKIIIINNNRSKENILKLSKDRKINKRNKNIKSLTRNYKNNLFSTYSNYAIKSLENKQGNYTNNNSNINNNTYLLKTFREKIHNKGFSKTKYYSIRTKSDSKMKHKKIIKEKKSNNCKIKKNMYIHAYITKKHCRTNTNLFANYISNFKNYNNNSIYNTTEIKKKNLTNFQRFSNNIKNINYTQRIKNTSSRDRSSPFHKMINSTCSLGTSINNKKKTKKVIKISTYKALENVPKLKNNNKNPYKKQASVQEKYKSNLKKNNNTFSRNVISLKLNKK